MPDYIECGWCGAREGEKHRLSCGKTAIEAMAPYEKSQASRIEVEPGGEKLPSDAGVKP